MNAMRMPFGWVLATLAVLTITLLSIGRADIVQLGIPATALCLGIWTYVTSPHNSFVRFILIAWLYAPLLRRLVDWQLGRTDVSPIIATPYIVTMIAWLSSNHALKSISKGEAALFLAYGLAVTYGGLNGILRGHGTAAVFDLLAYLGPMGLGLHLLSAGDGRADQRRQIAHLLILHTLVLCLYGLVQFLTLPPWDWAWMHSAAIASVGQPFPLLVRLYSTLNAPEIFALILMVALLIAPSEQPHYWLFIFLLATACLWLTLVRSAWGGAAIGFAVLLILGSLRQKLGVALGAVVVASSLLVSTQLLKFSDLPVDRVLSLFDLSDDQSLLARQDFIMDILPTIAGNPFGYGLGATGISAALADPNTATIRAFDSGLLDLIYTMGWAGTLVWGAVLAWGLMVLRTGWQSSETLPFSAAFWSLAVQMAFFNILVGFGGVLFFMLLAFGTIGPDQRETEP